MGVPHKRPTAKLGMSIGARLRAIGCCHHMGPSPWIAATLWAACGHPMGCGFPAQPLDRLPQSHETMGAAPTPGSAATPQEAATRWNNRVIHKHRRVHLCTELSAVGPSQLSLRSPTCRSTTHGARAIGFRVNGPPLQTDPKHQRDPRSGRRRMLPAPLLRALDVDSVVAATRTIEKYAPQVCIAQ